jgi:hypothetical protein
LDAERQHVENGYAAIAFPFARIISPPFVIEAGLFEFMVCGSEIQGCQ